MGIDSNEQPGFSSAMSLFYAENPEDIFKVVLSNLKSTLYGKNQATT